MAENSISFDASHLDELAALKAEQHALSELSSRAAAHRDKVAEVYGRVVRDYEARVQALEGQAQQLRQQVLGEFVALDGAYADASRQLDRARFELQELEFRRDIGEFSGEEFDRRVAAIEQDIVTRQRELERIGALRQKYLDILPPEMIRSAAPPPAAAAAPPPAPPAAPTAPAVPVTRPEAIAKPAPIAPPPEPPVVPFSLGGSFAGLVPPPPPVEAGPGPTFPAFPPPLAAAPPVPPFPPPFGGAPADAPKEPAADLELAHAEPAGSDEAGGTRILAASDEASGDTHLAVEPPSVGGTVVLEPGEAVGSGETQVMADEPAEGNGADTRVFRTASATQEVPPAPPVHTRGAILVEQRPDGTTFDHVLGEQTCIGRWSGNEIVLSSHEVSRRHAEIVRYADGYMLRDYKTPNRTYVNDEAVLERRLRDGDRVSIGSHIFVFKAR